MNSESNSEEGDAVNTAWWKSQVPPKIFPYLAIATDGRGPETAEHWRDALMLAFAAGDDMAVIELTLGVALAADDPWEMFGALMEKLRGHMMQAGRDADGLCRVMIAHSYSALAAAARGEDNWGDHGLHSVPRPFVTQEAI